MNFKEVKTLLKMMNVEMNEEHALHLFTVRGVRAVNTDVRINLRHLQEDLQSFEAVLQVSSTYNLWLRLCKSLNALFSPQKSTFDPLSFKKRIKHEAMSSFPQMADKSESGSLEIEEFVHFYKILTQRDEVWKVFQDYSGDGETLTLEELENFLAVEQQEGERSSRHAQELIQSYEPSETGGASRTALVEEC